MGVIMIRFSEMVKNMESMNPQEREKYLKDLIKELKKEKESTYFNEENTKVKTKKI
jgi:hypothetical protein